MILFYIIGAALSWFIIAGLLNAKTKSDFGRSSREDLGFAFGLGLLSSVMWPATLIIIFCLTGFAEHGWDLTTGKNK